MSALTNDAAKRHDFILLFDVSDGNPNGDPDNDNLPRTDPETGQGIVTDVCLKRKVRDYVATKHNNAPFRIYVQSRTYLQDFKKEAFDAHGLTKGEGDKGDKQSLAQYYMCKNFFDIRTFGAVLVGKKGEGYNCGQVRGPMQLTFARSIDPVFAHDISITRIALENSGEKPRESDDEKATHGTMGRKALLPYGLYRAYGGFNPLLAKKAGFSSDDLALFWEAVENMFELDRSAARGLMGLKGLFVFSHDRPTGNAPAHRLFESVAINLHKPDKPPRSFGDYEMAVPPEGAVAGFEGVSFTRLVG